MRPARAVAVGLVALAAALPLRAQVQIPSAGGASGLPAGATGVVVAAPPRVSAVRPATLALEGPLDADAYLVGPGDGFTVSIGGSVPRQFSVVVSADGRLVVPEAGSFAAAGRPLARVRADVQGALQRRFANVPTDVALAAPREFYVHVSGRVPEPGRHLVPAVARVEDAIEAASGQSLYDLAAYGGEPEGDAARWPALRSVRVEGRAGGTRTVDLMRYLAAGELASNPFLADGDRVVVPAFDPVAEGVVVGGAVDRPGTYDVRPGDSALDLVEATSGTGAAARIARVRRVRPGAPAVEVPLAEAGGVDVAPRDQVYAVPAEPDAARARVEGAVRYPGLYPVVRGRTTLDDLVEMAGGLRDDALARAAYLERSPAATDPTAGPASSPPAGSVAGSVAPQADLPDVSVDADLLPGLFGRQFFARQTAAPARVSLDPEAALAGRQAVALYDGDRLVVPFDLGVVRVYGRVARSGYAPFVAGATAADYVATAGGPTATADAVYVLDAATGQLVEGEGTAVRPGDAVFVNSLPSPDTPELANLALQERRDEREDARDRRANRFQAFQAVLSVVGTVASLVIAYVSVQRLDSTSSN